MSRSGRFFDNEISSVVYEPGRELVGFVIVVDKSVYGTTEYHRKLIEVISKYGATVRLVKVSRPFRGDKAYVVFYADVTGRLGDAVKMLEELRKIPFFERVELIRPVMTGLLVDVYSFPLTFLGERAIVLRKATYAAMLKAIREKYGPGFEAVLYTIGFEVGYHACENHKNLVGSINALLKVSCELFRSLGYGVLEILKFRDDECVSRVYDCFECELFKGSGKPASHFVRGMIAGWCAAAWNADIANVVASEVKCIAKGDRTVK